jgi:membrane-bound lytic murein transglycosylase A
MRALASVLIFAGLFTGAAAAPCEAEGRGFSLEPAALTALPGFGDDASGEALAVWRKSCGRIPFAPNLPELRPEAWKKACAAANGARSAADFFTGHFRAFRVVPDQAPDSFFTGYYQPEIPGALTPTREFSTPAYARPADLVTTSQLAGLTSARRGAGGALEPYPDRAAIEDGALEGTGAKKLVYLRDKADLFLAQVQGSARVRLPDGRVFHLSFAARNGQPYTAIARILVQRGAATPEQMTMPLLIAWLRDHGLKKGEEGDALLRQNRSFVFFEGRFDKDAAAQPQGASGAALTPLRSIAVDKAIWPYGLPFFIDAALPWRGEAPEPFQRVMIAQDTGSAIVGPGRADIYFGLGDKAGARAGALRHHGQLYLLLPRE